MSAGLSAQIMMVFELPPQGILQNHGQLALPVRHKHVLLRVHALLSERRDAVAQHRKRKVDRRAFFQTISG